MSFGNGAMKAFNKHTQTSGNETTAAFTQLPANILEAFIPGYSVISSFLLDAIGFDITLVVSICFLIFGLFTSLKFLWKHAYSFVETYLMSYIRIDSNDDIFDHIMDWIATQQVSRDSRKLLAKTGRENAWESDEGDEEEVDANTLINFSQWDSKVPPKFEPSFGSHHFFHRGMLFEFRRDQEYVMGSKYGYTRLSENEHITLTCLSRSTQPIKDLIMEARDRYLHKEKACTVVRRPVPKESRYRDHNWMRVATRPSRPMETVVLDPEQKNTVLRDINEYLLPATKFWYSNRGIPYRRGYLLHGPPGTGKSSLAWAIAGVFGLDIYSISLVDPSVTEEHLGVLFTELPRRCVVLLEDIDSAGLVKRQESARSDKEEETEASKIGAEITKAFESVQKKRKDTDDQGISLSGLLNAIDGVASHEGRVLIMTSNFPEKLDDALIRPGRIDMKVAFTNATRAQARELFIRMYSPDTRGKFSISTSKDPIKLPAPRVTTKTTLDTKPLLEKTTAKLSTVPVVKTFTPPASPDLASTFTTTGTNTPEISISGNGLDLEEIAYQFAERLPEKTFSPAEVQGFLLTRKKDPLKALAEVGAWRDDLLAAQEEKRKKEVGKGEVKGEVMVEA